MDSVRGTVAALAFFALAVAVVFLMRRVWASAFRSRAATSDGVDEVERALWVVCFASIVLALGGFVILLAGYAAGAEIVTTVGAIMITVSLPLLLVAEHVGKRSR
jgi:hypothetical protein